MKRGRDESLSFFLQQQKLSSFISQQRGNSKSFQFYFYKSIMVNSGKKYFYKKSKILKY